MDIIDAPGAIIRADLGSLPFPSASRPHTIRCGNPECLSPTLTHGTVSAVWACHRLSWDAYASAHDAHHAAGGASELGWAA